MKNHTLSGFDYSKVVVTVDDRNYVVQDSAQTPWCMVHPQLHVSAPILDPLSTALTR
jgi:hypothetical protein